MMYTCDVCNGNGKFHGFFCDNCGGTGKVDWVRNLVRKSSDKNILHWACINGNLSKVKSLVEQGIDICTNNDNALRFAAENGHLDIVRFLFLINRDISVHAYDDSAIRWAANYGHLEVVKFLVEQGANIRAYDNVALRWSVENGHLEVVKFLVEQGADVHIYNDFILCVAIHNGHFEVVKFLVEQGGDVHACTCTNEALRWSTDRKYPEVVEYLTKIITKERK